MEIKESESQRKLSKLQKRFEKYDLTILDECGYKSFDKEGAEALFNLISLRAGLKSIIITTNLGFDKWDQIFTDKVIAAAIVDRLTFKAYIIDIMARCQNQSDGKMDESTKTETKIRKMNTFANRSFPVHFSVAILFNFGWQWI